MFAELDELQAGQRRPLSGPSGPITIWLRIIDIKNSSFEYFKNASIYEAFEDFERVFATKLSVTVPLPTLSEKSTVHQSGSYINDN